VKTSNSLAQAQSLIETILSEMSGPSKLRQPQFKFMRWIFIAWLGLPVRHTMLNLARFGPYCEKTIRLHMARTFCFAEFGRLLIAKHCGSERVCVFDPTFVAKAGRHTYGVDSWWCGTLQRALRGLEVGVLGVIDVDSRSAFALQATQTPARKVLQERAQSLLEHYISLIHQQYGRLQQLGIGYLAVDAYFAKKEFVDAMREKQLHVVSRLRADANLRYLYRGPRNKRGRPKLYDGKMDCRHIDKRRLRRFGQDERCCYYSGVVNAVALGRNVRIVYIEERSGAADQDTRYCILMSSDVTLAPEKIVHYYQLRFSIEFLIRDAKSHAGLEECQARDEAKLHFHFNLALSAVSVAKAACWLWVPSAHRGAFSMRNVTLLFTFDLLAQRVFHSLGLDPSLEKYQRAYQHCLNIEKLAA
jgi:hypothetical protein